DSWNVAQPSGALEVTMTTAHSARYCRSLLTAALLCGWLSQSAAQEPAPAAATAAEGQRVYYNHCASCHGASAEGDGPVASVMRVTVPNLRNLAERNDGRFPAEAVRAYVDGRTLNAAHGERLMPIWGDVFLAAGAGDEAAATRRIAALVEFIAGIQYPR